MLQCQRFTQPEAATLYFRLPDSQTATEYKSGIIFNQCQRDTRVCLFEHTLPGKCFSFLP